MMLRTGIIGAGNRFERRYALFSGPDGQPALELMLTCCRSTELGTEVDVP